MRIVVAVVLFACITAPTLGAAGAPVVFTIASIAPSPSACSSQIIVTFAAPLDGDPDDVLVTSLATTAGIQLAFLRSAGPGLYVFALADRESDSSCHDSLQRLLRDPRVRSAEIDVRRKPQLTRF
jgi:hypothetical protein